MDNDVDKKRLKQIQKMLMEFASGNFAYKLERTDLNDEIEALTALVNMTFEEIKAFFIHQGYVNLNETYKHLVQMFFVLDMESTIIAYNSRVKQMLYFEDKEIHEQPFTSFLTKDSKLAWRNLLSKFLLDDNDKTHEEFIVLSFKTKQGLILTSNCLVSRFISGAMQSGKIIVTSIEIIMNSKERESKMQQLIKSGKSNVKTPPLPVITTKDSKQLQLSSRDVTQIRQVYDHIISNLDKPLAPLIELAHTFGTNEYKLKYGFKQLYGQTIFRFLVNERLRKASLLIQHTDIPIKEIAHVTGFISLPHFSKAFKKKYGYTPRDLRKQFYSDRT